MGCVYAKTISDLESEVSHLKKEIEYLHQGSVARPANKEELAAETARKIEHLREEEVSYDLLTPSQQAQFKQNCVDLVHVEYELHDLREDISAFRNTRRVLDLNIGKAMEAAAWEEELERLKEEKVQQRKKLKKAGFDLDEFEQRKLNSELAKLRISKEYARENYKAAKLAEQKDSSNKNAKAEFALKRKELNARRIHQEKEFRESLDGVRESKQEMMMIEQGIGKLEEKIKQTLRSLYEARCVRALTKLDKEGTGLLSEPQVVRVLRAQCLMDAVPPPELELLVDILSLFREYGVAPEDEEEARIALLQNAQAQLPPPMAPIGGVPAKKEMPASASDAQAHLVEYENYHLPLHALVQFVLEKHRESKAHGLSCAAVSVAAGVYDDGGSALSSPAKSPGGRSHAGVAGSNPGSPGGISPPLNISSPGAGLMSTSPGIRGNPSSSDQLPGSRSPSLLLHGGSARSKTLLSPSGGEEAKDAATSGSGGVADKADSEAEALRAATAAVEAEFREEVDTDPLYFDRLLEVYCRLWERDAVYHGVRALIQRQCLVTLGPSQSLSAQELETFYEALDRTLRKRYPDEEEGWFGVSPRENAHEALRALRDRLQEAKELQGTATAAVLEEELQALPPSMTPSTPDASGGHSHTHGHHAHRSKQTLMLARLRKRVGAFITGIHLSELLATTTEEQKENPRGAGAGAGAGAGTAPPHVKEAGKRGNDDDDDDDDDDDLPPAYEDHELPDAMPLNYASHFISSRLGPADLPTFSVFFEHTVQGEKAASWEVY